MKNILTLGNGKAVLVNGKCILYKVEFENFENRMQIARLIFAKYTDCFSNIAEVISTLRAYEKTGDLVINKHCAYILHNAN